MRIKQIELNGFKSFMERTLLELPAGVTAIVGPNGCGKSNIVDAIRWLLGEQSPRHLRGAAMEDVIFTGNADNGPLGMAEVSLLLERDEEDIARAAAEPDGDEAIGDGLPPELAHLSEILVTRRYFRSGESEYFINRAPCRLKDITELFLGTGVGTRAYAIIEQGRVEQLISAKPEDLRLFLEEAAGTTRFRSRKVAAERKMARTRDNLVRVQDVLRELERQMASLERQARRAEEYHRIKGELRDLDLRVMAGRQRAWAGELQTLADRHAVLLADEAALQDEIRRTRGASNEAQTSRVANADRLRVVNEDITAERLASGDARARMVAQTERARELSELARACAQEGEALAARALEMRAEVVALTAEVERLESAQPLTEQELAAHEARLRGLGEEGVPLEAAVEDAKDALADGLAEEARLRNMAEALRQRREELDGRRRKLEDVQRGLADRLRANAQAAEGARVAIERLECERTELHATRRRLGETQEGLARKEAEALAVLERARLEATQLRSRAESLRELQTRYEGCTRGVASLVQHDPQGAGLLAGVLRVPAELERAVAAALGSRLTQAVVADTASAVRAVGWLRDSGGGSATVVPRDPERRAAVIVPSGRRLVDQIEVDAQHWALAEALLGQVLLAEDLEAALTLWREASHPVLVVTRTGEAIDTLGAVTGGSEPPLEETVLARTRELRELEAAVARSAEHVGRAETALASVRVRAAETAAAASRSEERLQALQLDLVAAQKDRERLDAERERINAELEVGALEAGGLAGEDGEVAGALASLDERRETLGRGVQERRARLAEQQAALVRWREAYAGTERCRTEAAVRAAAGAERLQALRGDVSRQAARAVETEERAAATRARLAEATAGAEAARRSSEEAEAAQGAAEIRLAHLASEHERLAAAIAESEAILSADDRAERAAHEQLEATRELRAGVEVTLAERRLALEHLAAQLAERYDLPVAALGEVVVESDGREGEREGRAEALRARLVRLGDVNPAAMGELEELGNRHGFLQSQQADLERSLEDLRRTIAKLNRTSRQRFEETFSAANEKLAQVFPKLFPGGTARLELTTPEEGGEPGIEIVVQPAGKKLQTLSLLSGGEKALTAVALILSLFLIRPTPFCLLDEVDAPLDEANIGRFNQLVREMAEASQFVLITHNRRTMEVADTLYGITMQQAGVSKVVSVRLREAA